MPIKYIIKKDDLPYGTYTFKVRAKAEGYADSDLSNTVTYTHGSSVSIVLSTPIEISVSNKILKWKTVSNASSYLVNIDGTDYPSLTNNYSLNSLTTEKTYSLKVKAIGDGTTYANSDYSAVYSYTVSSIVPQLNTPTGLYTYGGYLGWDSVANASYYYAEIDYVDFITYSTSYLLPTEPGEYMLRVRALGDGINYNHSNYSSSIYYTVEGTTPVQLDMPTGLFISGSTLYWNGVSNVDSYYVFINGSYYTNTSGTSVSLPTTTGSYSIEVVATSNNSDFTDSYPASITYTVEPPVINVSAPEIAGETVQHPEGYWYIDIQFYNTSPYTVTLEFSIGIDYEPSSFDNSWHLAPYQSAPYSGHINMTTTNQTAYIMMRAVYDDNNYSSTITTYQMIPAWLP